MKNTIKIFGITSMSLVLFSCSSVQVANSWKDVKTTTIKEKNVLVINKTDDDIVRVQFETDLVKNLNKHNINAVESFKVFPKIDTSKELNKTELNVFKNALKADGIDVILLTVLKETQDIVTTRTTNNTIYSMHSYPVYYRRGFYRFYNTYYIDPGPVISVTSEGKKYILETITYDLTQEENEQLLSVITTEIENPQTLGTTSKDFSNKVIKELVK